MRILITGASGQLGGYLLQQLQGSPHEVVAWSGSRSAEFFGVRCVPVDLTKPEVVAAAFQQARPDVMIHAAAVSSIADCHRDPEHARKVNVVGTRLLTELAARARSRLVYVSTDLVFDGTKPSAYQENDRPAPLSIYGQTKAEAEQAVLAIPRSVVVRVSLMFGPTLVNRPAFFDQQLTALREGRPITCFVDEWRTPLSLRTGATALLSLAESNVDGLLHLGGPERLSRAEMAVRLAELIGADPGLIIHARREDAQAAEPRPRDTSLNSARWRTLFPEQAWPTFKEALLAMGVTR